MRQLDYLRTLLGFAFRENPLLYASVGLSILSVVLELAAMVSLLPLISVAAGQPLPQGDTMVRIAREVGVNVDGRALLLIFVGLFGLRIVTQIAGQGLILLISKRLLAQFATRAFSSLVSAVPLKEVERASIGSFITLIGDESFRASNVVVSLNQFLVSGLLAGLYYAAVLRYSTVVGIGVLLFLALSFLAMFESFRISHRLGNRQVEQSQAANSLFLDALNGLRSVRAFSAEAYVTTSYRQQMSCYMRTLFSVDLITLLTRLGPALLLLGAVAAIAVWPVLGTSLNMDFPFVVTIVIFLLRFFPVVGQTLNVALRVVADARAGKDVTALIDAHRPPQEAETAQLPSSKQVERIDAVNVVFSHEADKHVMKDLNLGLERGRSYALVGLSGSGKSTFLDLLMAFYPVDGGRILVNGTLIDEVRLADLRRRVLLVSQETTIFNDTVASNLLFGCEASRSDVERACRIACIEEFIAGLPQGYDTLLTYRGANLSGGQRQRIGIARAVLRRPDVLMLDESTSALDAETRAKVVANLITEFRDRILLFVTHDAFVVSQVTDVLDMTKINRAQPLPQSKPSADVPAWERMR